MIFVLAYDTTDNDESGIKNNKKSFLPKAEIKNHNLLIDVRNFYDQLINDLINLSKQRSLDAALTAIKQTVFQGIAGQKLRLYTVLKKSKETVLEFYKGTAKVL